MAACLEWAQWKHGLPRCVCRAPASAPSAALVASPRLRRAPQRNALRPTLSRARNATQRSASPLSARPEEGFTHASNPRATHTVPRASFVHPHPLLLPSASSACYSSPPVLLGQRRRLEHKYELEHERGRRSQQGCRRVHARAAGRRRRRSSQQAGSLSNALRQRHRLSLVRQGQPRSETGSSSNSINGVVGDWESNGTLTATSSSSRSTGSSTSSTPSSSTSKHAASHGGA